MGNTCGSAKTHKDSPTHHRLGSVSDSAPPTVGATSRPPAQPRPAGQPKPPAPAKATNEGDERERRAKAAEERAKAASARGTSSSNPKQGQLAAKANKPVSNQPYQREEEPLRWD
ncbi:hypothetical protein FRC10_010507 [Ceratobasidium sp. 414]|nr:hypothetical protein FRC10_010507 [Ceratobasidium sp. 414]